jgi:hypothetical protein
MMTTVEASGEGAPPQRVTPVAPKNPVAQRWVELVEQAAWWGCAVRTSYQGRSALDLGSNTIWIANDLEPLDRVLALAQHVGELAARRDPQPTTPTAWSPRRALPRRPAIFGRFIGVLDLERASHRGVLLREPHTGAVAERATDLDAADLAAIGTSETPLYEALRRESGLVDTLPASNPSTADDQPSTPNIARQDNSTEAARTVRTRRDRRLATRMNARPGHTAAGAAAARMAAEPTGSAATPNR